MTLLTGGEFLTKAEESIIVVLLSNLTDICWGKQPLLKRVILLFIKIKRGYSASKSSLFY